MQTQLLLSHFKLKLEREGEKMHSRLVRRTESQEEAYLV